MTIRTIHFTETGLQYVVDLLRTRTIAEAGELYDDVRAQVMRQDADAAAAARRQIEDDVRASMRPPAEPSA